MTRPAPASTESGSRKADRLASTIFLSDTPQESLRQWRRHRNRFARELELEHLAEDFRRAARIRRPDARRVPS